MGNRNFEFRILNLEFLSVAIILVIAFIGCSEIKNSSDSTKFQQYFVQGEQLYAKHCSNCHQSTGKGLGLVYPPLAQSDFMKKNFEQVLCLMKYGIKGEVIVNGKSYVQPMPGVQSLTDLEIAEIATYIYNSWEHKHGLIDVTEASRIIGQCE
jgi:cytochrome c551